MFLESFDIPASTCIKNKTILGQADTTYLVHEDVSGARLLGEFRFRQTVPRRSHKQQIQPRTTKGHAGRLPRGNLENPVNFTIGRISHHTPSPPMSAPDVTARIDAGPIGIGVLRRSHKFAPVGDDAASRIELVGIDRTQRRIGKIDPRAVGTPADAVRDRYSALALVGLAAAVDAVEIGAVRLGFSLDHRAGPEAPLAIHSAVIETYARYFRIRTCEPFGRSAVRLIERNAAL